MTETIINYTSAKLYFFSPRLKKACYEYVTTHFQLQAFQTQYPVITYFAALSQNKGILFGFRSFPFFLLDWNETPVFSATCSTGVAEKLPINTALEMHTTDS